MPTHGDAFNRGFKGHGKGMSVQGLTKFRPVKLGNFQAGEVLNDASEDVPDSALVAMSDLRITNRDTLTPTNGTADLGYAINAAAKQMAMFVGLKNLPQLVIFAGATMHFIDRASGTMTTLLTGPAINPAEPFAWTTYGDYFIFGNNLGSVYTYEYPAVGPIGTLVAEPLIPNGKTFAVAKARLLVGGVTLFGVYYPMGIAWSGLGGHTSFDFTNDEGSGFEQLIGNQTEGDEIMAVRAMGLDSVAILCRHSIWVGRPTGDIDRPFDFQPRVVGKGCVAKNTAIVTAAGVIYLSRDGVEVFDGNTTTKLSKAVDATLLPIGGEGALDYYHASYDTQEQLYMLHTATRTMVLDILNARWWERFLVSKGAALYYDVAGELWMTHLGETNLGAMRIHREVKGVFTQFGFALDPYFDSKNFEADYTGRLVTTNQLTIKYQNGVGDSNVSVWALDHYNPAVIAAPIVQNLVLDGFSRRDKKVNCNVTARGIGVRFVINSGDVEIFGLELSCRLRGRRIEGGA